QPVGDEAHDRGRGLAGGDRPDAQAQHHRGKQRLERRCNVHLGDPSWRTIESPRWPLASAARAMSWETAAPASRTSNQTQISLNPPRTLPACGSSPNTTRPKPRLSALVSACKRVSVSGKRSRPTVPARKKNAPVETAMIVTMSSAKLIRRPLIRDPPLRDGKAPS